MTFFTILGLAVIPMSGRVILVKLLKFTDVYIFILIWLQGDIPSGVMLIFAHNFQKKMGFRGLLWSVQRYIKVALHSFQLAQSRT